MTFNEARRAAVKFIAANKNVKAVTSIALRGNDDLVLIEVGARGGHRCIWNFTTGKRSYNERIWNSHPGKRSYSKY